MTLIQGCLMFHFALHGLLFNKGPFIEAELLSDGPFEVLLSRNFTAIIFN